MKAKVWYQSKTYQGLIVMIAGVALGYLGYNGQEIGMIKGDLMEILGLVGNLIGTLMIAHGRNVANTAVTLTKKGAEAHNAKFTVEVEPGTFDETDPLKQPE